MLKQKNITKTLIFNLILILFCIIALYPILRIISVSLRPGDRLMSTSLRIIPKDASLTNYQRVLFEENFFQWLWNSLLITLITAALGLLIAATSAYAISRWKFWGRRAILVFLLATQMIPAGMMMIPLFLIATKMGLTDSYSGLILAYSVGAVPFSIWTLKGFYDTIPKQLEEAALIDGAGRMYTFWKIIVPLASPAIAVAFLFNFMTSWNEFMLARIMIRKQVMFTWPLGLQSLQMQFQTAWGAYSAASVLIAIPVVALFLYSSKWLVSGLTLGSVKG